MKTLLLSATYLVGIGELFLAIFFWATHSKSEIRKVMALLALSTGVWVFFGALIAYKPTSESIHFFEALVFSTGALIITSLLHLVLIFPFRLKDLDRLHLGLMYTPAFIFSIAAIFTKSISQGSTGTPSFAGSVIAGPLYPVYNFCLFIAFLLVLAVLIYRIYTSSGQHRKILSQFFGGVILGASPAVFLDLLSYFIDKNFLGNYLWGSVSTVFWLGVVTYIVLKK